MRGVLVFCAIAAAFAVKASAEETYVLIDNSGSMSRAASQSEAESIATHTILGLDEQSPVSVTYFGGKNGGDCVSPVRISALKPSSTSLPLNPPPAKNSTPIAASIDALSAKVGNVPANVLIITDGADTCGADICASAKQLLTSHPQMSMSLRLIGASPANEDALGCIANARESMGRRNIQINAEALETETSTGNQIPFWIGSVLTISALVLLLLPTLALNALLRHFTALVRETEPPKQIRSIVGFSVAAALALIGIMATWIVKPADFYQIFLAIHSFANQPVWSRLIPNAVLGYVGWLLIQIWSIQVTRHEKLNHDFMKRRDEERKSEREKQREERQKALEKELEEKRLHAFEQVKAKLGEADNRDLEVIERKTVYLTEENATLLENTFQIVREVRRKIEEKIGTIPDYRNLGKYANLSTNSVSLLIIYLTKDGLVGSEQASSLRLFFSDWSKCLGSLRYLSQETCAYLNQFDVESFRFGPSTSGDNAAS